MLGKSTGHIAGYSTKRKGYLTSKKGYYLHGFTTTINRGTKKDYDMSLNYARELVSSFETIDIRLLMLKLEYENNTISTNTHRYFVKIGAMVVGKITILVQQIDKHYNITFIYEYRTNYSQFSKNLGISKRTYNHVTGSKLTRNQRKNSAQNKKLKKE